MYYVSLKGSNITGNEKKGGREEKQQEVEEAGKKEEEADIQSPTLTFYGMNKAFYKPCQGLSLFILVSPRTFHSLLG